MGNYPFIQNVKDVWLLVWAEVAVRSREREMRQMMRVYERVLARLERIWAKWDWAKPGEEKEAMRQELREIGIELNGQKEVLDSLNLRVEQQRAFLRRMWHKWREKESGSPSGQ